MTTEFARIRSVTPQMMADMARGMEGWVMITGEEAPAAARKLAQAISDPEKFLQLLEKETHGVSAATMEMVARLVDANDVMQAKAVAAREFGEVMERAAAKMKTPFQQAALDAANALQDLAHAFAGSGEKGEGLAASMRTLAEVIRGLELPIAVVGKALRDLMDMITMVVQAAMAGFAAMKTVAVVAAEAVVEFTRVIYQAVKGDLSEAQKAALDMPRKLAEEWGVRSAEVKRHLDEIRAAMRDISEPYLPGHQTEKPNAPGGEKPAPTATGTVANESDREKLALEALNRNLTIRRELRQIDGDRKILTEQLTALEGRMAGAAGETKAGLSAQVSDIKSALQELDERQEKLTKKDGGETKMEGFRRELAELQAADKRSLDERKADDLKFWQAKQANLERGGKDYAQVTIEIRRLEKAIAADAHNERLADLERQRAAAHKGSEERIILARREAEEVKRYAGEHSKAYQDSLKRIEEMVKEHQKELDRIEADGLEARSSAKKADLETDAENLRFLRGLGVVDEHEQLARLRQIKEQEYQIERDALDQKLKLKSLEAAEKDRINKQIQQLDQGHRAQDLSATHQQTLAVLHDWQTTSSGIGSAFGGAIKGMIVQGQTFQQAERNLALGLGNVFADLALRKIGTWIWSEGVMRAWSKITGQQEVVDAAAKETAKTAATTAGQAARTSATVAGTAARNAAGATEQAGFFARIGEQIAQWLGLETAKTAETVAQAGAREGVESEAGIIAIAAAKAQALGEIPSYAAIGAAAAMASVAAIPFVGWAMAPEVGAEHFAMAMAFLPMASAEGGWEHVPADGMITELHKDEKVLSAPFSRRLDQLMNNVEVMQQPGAMALPMPGPPVLPMPSSAGTRPVPLAARMADALGGSGRDGDIHIHAVDAASINNLMRRPGVARNTVDVMRAQAGQGNYVKRGK
ncbi:ATPase involved in DNA repair [Paramagnetospirillum magneticum AMB-1]|uniref:ATPase involved in DNA repair n=1 Tax=Paramagnetospirillum magneticum (strain ATCC 700264 / AMB-1) TaxID=342108 RepID=Q2W6E4_PARM1|nr:ATPase involved in DNA repair [Paramagnetospirillum magneticum AMB-1]